MADPAFVHLHVHSSYSLLEGALPIARLAELAKADPVKTRGAMLELRRSFFANRDHGHLDATAARTFQDEKRKIAVTGYEAPALRILRN